GDEPKAEKDKGSARKDREQCPDEAGQDEQDAEHGEEDIGAGHDVPLTSERSNRARTRDDSRESCSRSQCGSSRKGCTRRSRRFPPGARRGRDRHKMAPNRPDPRAQDRKGTGSSPKGSPLPEAGRLLRAPYTRRSAAARRREPGDR